MSVAPNREPELVAPYPEPQLQWSDGSVLVGPSHALMLVGKGGTERPIRRSAAVPGLRKRAKAMLQAMQCDKASCPCYFCIRKTFAEGQFTGYVCAWHGPKCGYYVLYEDGDREHMDESEVLELHEAYLRWRLGY